MHKHKQNQRRLALNALRLQRNVARREKKHINFGIIRRSLQVLLLGVRQDRLHVLAVAWRIGLSRADLRRAGISCVTETRLPNTKIERQVLAVFTNLR